MAAAVLCSAAPAVCVPSPDPISGAQTQREDIRASALGDGTICSSRFSDEKDGVGVYIEKSKEPPDRDCLVIVPLTTAVTGCGAVEQFIVERPAARARHSGGAEADQPAWTRLFPNVWVQLL